MPVEDLSANRLWRNATGPGEFDTMGTPLVNGRDFADADRVGAPLSPSSTLRSCAAINLASGRSAGPCGIGLSNGERRYEIVGLVGDSAYTSPRDGMMATMSVPLAQIQPLGETVILTINADRGQRAAVEREVAAALARTEPAIAFVFRTFDQFIDARITQERLIAMLSSFSADSRSCSPASDSTASSRKRCARVGAEIGLRLALGAPPARDRASGV